MALISNFYDRESRRNADEYETSRWRAQEAKVDERPDRHRSENEFELTGLEAQIIRSAFQDTEKEKIQSYLDKPRNGELEGDVVPKRVEEREITGEYIRQLKRKFESWHQQSEDILNRQIQQSETFRLEESALNEKLFLTNQRGSKLGALKDHLASNERTEYLKRKDYESELNEYKNQNLKPKRKWNKMVEDGPDVVRRKSRVKKARGKRSKSVVFERLTQVGESKVEKMRRMREEYQNRELENCTFKPNLSKSRLRRKKSRSSVTAARKRAKTKSQNKAKATGVGNRLFTEAKKKEERMRKRQEEKKQRELQQIRDNLQKGRSKWKSANRRPLGSGPKEEKHRQAG